MKKHIVVAACLSAALVGTTAHAANKAETFVISPFVGGYTFDGKQHLETWPVYGIRGGYNFTDHVGAEAVFDYVSTESTRAAGDADVYNYRLEALYHFFPEARLVPYLAAGYGAITVDQDQKKTTRGAFNYGAGLKYFLTDTLALRGDVRHLVMNKERTLHNLEYTVGAALYFGGAQPAPKAVAPEPAPTPKPVVQPPPTAPAPAAPTATLSAAPGTITPGQAVTLSWSSQHATSCTIQPDGETVAPQGSKTVTPAAATAYTLTCTGDGGTATSAANVAVNQPAAPTATLSIAPTTVTKGESAKLSWTSQNATNCDIQPGVGAVQPQGSTSVTPAAPTTYTLNCTGAGGKASSTANVALSEKLCITLKVQFDTDKAVIKPKYHNDIKQVGDFLNKYPNATGVIEGHTDNQGGAEYNLKLSQKRADAVRAYIIDKFGIAGDRLTAKGYGLTKPVADNATAEGRAKNRRIDATIDCVVTVTK